MNKNNLKRMSRLAIVASLYIALTVVFSLLSYGNIQFRLAEILIFLCFFRKDYGVSLVLGCLIANIFSPLGIIDVAFGTIATILSVVCVMFCKKLWFAIFPPVIFNGIIVGIELNLVLELPLILSMISVIIGEAVVLVIGCFVFSKLRKNNKFLELIEANQNI